MKLLSRAVEMMQRAIFGLRVVLLVCMALGLVAAHEMASKTGVLAAASESTVQAAPSAPTPAKTPANADYTGQPTDEHAPPQVDYWSMLFVFLLATFIGLGALPACRDCCTPRSCP